MVQVVIAGLVPNLSDDKSDDEEAVRIFNQYVYPAVGGTTLLFTPLIGYIIQREGFWIPMFLNVLVTQVCIALCWAPTLDSQYAMLIFLNLIQGLAYTMQFAYVQLTYEASLYGPLIAFLIAAQGIVGLIAWPGLSPNPFGASNFTPVLIICLVPTFFLYYVPYQQYPHDQDFKVREVKMEMKEMGGKDRDAITTTKNASNALPSSSIQRFNVESKGADDGGLSIVEIGEVEDAAAV